MKTKYFTRREREFLEIIAYIFLGYLIAVGANKGMTYGLNTNYPVVAVVSKSMEHNDPQQTFFPYFSEKNFTGAQIKNLPFESGIRMGDIVVVRGTPFEKIKVGDVIVYKFPGREPIIHRVVAINGDSLTTKGDNNKNEDQLLEGIAPPIKAENVKGKAIMHIPILGYVKIIYLKAVKKG